MVVSPKEIERVALALERIASVLEGLMESTNPLNELQEWKESDIPRVEYTNEDREIVEYKLRQMGKEYKERK